MKKQSSTQRQHVMFAVIFGLLALFTIQAASVQAATGTTVSSIPSTATPALGETFTVNITVSNVQNLYGVDVALSWNASVLQVLNVDLRLGVESHPDGVLHEILPDTEIDVVENDVSAEAGTYHIAATSVNPAPSFSGSGNIAVLTFNVTKLGQTGLTLETELADYPASGETANLIEHTNNAGAISVIPEFPALITFVLLLALATAAVAFSKKHLKPTTQIT
jgi:hypothetical protein